MIKHHILRQKFINVLAHSKNHINTKTHFWKMLLRFWNNKQPLPGSDKSFLFTLHEQIRFEWQCTQFFCQLINLAAKRCISVHQLKRNPICVINRGILLNFVERKARLLCCVQFVLIKDILFIVQLSFYLSERNSGTVTRVQRVKYHRILTFGTWNLISIFC